MEYELKPFGYKTVNQWKKEGKIPINESAVKKYYATTYDGKLYIRNGKAQVYEYVSPEDVIDEIEFNKKIADDVYTPAFRKDKSFLSNMHPCEIKVSMNGQDYIFPSAENLYQACKNPDFASYFTTMSPAESKSFWKTHPWDARSWEDIKDGVMKKVLYFKFKQNPDLMEKLCKCDFQITERNEWHDTYWGVYNGIGYNKLGNLLESIKCEALGIPFCSSQEKAVAIGNYYLQKQADLAKQYGYKKLDEKLSYETRKEYASNLPDFFYFECNKKEPIHSRDGVLLAKKWQRVVIGDYGAFIEIDDKDACRENLSVKKGEEYRIDDPKYSNSVKYQWFVPCNGYEAKMYFQQAEVVYADYKAGKWYVSPYETQEGSYISGILDYTVTKKVEKTVSNEITDALNREPFRHVNIPEGIVIFDTETTGFSSSAEILQISVVDINGNTILDTYIKPTRATSWPQSMEIHHISPEMVKDAPSPIEIAPIIRNIFESADLVVGFNVNFDIRMLKQNFGIFIPPEKKYDVFSQFKKDFPIQNSHKLGDAVKLYCPDMVSKYEESKHSSLTDTLVTSKVFLKQLDMQKDVQIEDIER